MNADWSNGTHSSCQHYEPSLEAIAEAFQSSRVYGLPPPPDDHDVWSLLLRYAPTKPLQVYCLGASCGCETVCVRASEHTLGTRPSSVREVEATTMGAVYLRRLFFLHLGRTEALKRILRPKPIGHPVTTTCSAKDQKTVLAAWDRATSVVMLQDLPQNTSPVFLAMTFNPIATSVSCPECGEQVRQRILSMIPEWQRVRRTI